MLIHRKYDSFCTEMLRRDAFSADFKVHVFGIGDVTELYSNINVKNYVVYLQLITAK